MKERSDQVYPSDISREQFEHIAEVLNKARKKTSPQTVDRLHIFNAILYLLREGCRWRPIPKDYPNWQLCYYYFRVWSTHIDKESGKTVLDLALKKVGCSRACIT